MGLHVRIGRPLNLNEMKWRNKKYINFRRNKRSLLARPEITSTHIDFVKRRTSSAQTIPSFRVYRYGAQTAAEQKSLQNYSSFAPDAKQRGGPTFFDKLKIHRSKVNHSFLPRTGPTKKKKYEKQICCTSKYGVIRSFMAPSKSLSKTEIEQQRKKTKLRLRNVRENARYYFNTKYCD